LTFTNLLHLFNRTANKLNVTPQLEAAHICEIARRIIKEDYNELWEDCTVSSFKDGNLNLGALNSNSAQELFYIRTQLLQKLNQHFPVKPIKQIKIRLELNKKEDNYYS